MKDPADIDPAMKEKLASDPQRPKYHFLPPANWMNDPNGAIFWKGRYHLFYQYNPNGAFWGTMHWGHAASEDLVHWDHLPIALAPTPGGPDRDGCYSGHAVDNDGVPTFIYYGCPEGNCIAIGSDDLLTWRKPPANPVIAHPPKGQEEWRPWDPCAWKEGDTWYSLSGGAAEGIGDTAFLFRSKDLLHWEYMHRFYESALDKEPESDCAVPDFFPLGDRHMLLFASHKRGTQYYIGTYADHRFHPEQHGRMNFGPFGHGGLNAPITFEDAAGRRIFIGWIGEGRPEEVQRASGWSGVMSLPRVLSLSGDGALLVEPAPELAVLRGDHCRCGDIPIPPRSNVFLQDVRGECLEIGTEMEPDDAEEFGLKLRCSPRCEEQTLISYNHAEKCLSLDVGRSSLSPDVEDRGAECGPLELAEGESLKLRIFLDRSVVEVFANGRLCLTKRIYPSRSDSLGVALFARGGRAKLRSMDAWHMSSIWPAGDES